MPKTPAKIASETGSAMNQKIFEAAKNMQASGKKFDVKASAYTLFRMRV
jgi:hypothetical protein